MSDELNPLALLLAISCSDPDCAETNLRALAEEWHECCGDIHEPLNKAADLIDELCVALESAIGLLWEHAAGLEPHIEKLEATLTSAREVPHSGWG